MARRGFPFALLRTMLLAAIGVIACIWALSRAYKPKPPMVVPVVPVGPMTEDSARPGEIVAPEILPQSAADR